jgi:hypothetical protein
MENIDLLKFAIGCVVAFFTSLGLWKLDEKLNK